MTDGKKAPPTEPDSIQSDPSPREELIRLVGELLAWQWLQNRNSDRSDRKGIDPP